MKRNIDKAAQKEFINLLHFLYSAAEKIGELINICYSAYA